MAILERDTVRSLAPAVVSTTPVATQPAGLATIVARTPPSLPGVGAGQTMRTYVTMGR